MITGLHETDENLFMDFHDKAAELFKNAFEENTETTASGLLCIASSFLQKCEYPEDDGEE